MFDEFFYRRRKNKAILIVMVAMMVLGVALFTMGILYLF